MKTVLKIGTLAFITSLLPGSVHAAGADFIMTRDMVSAPKCAEFGKDLPAVEADFLRVICEYHQDSDSEKPQVLEKRVQVLQSVQTQGLNSSKQELAVLLEGLTHCQQAKIAMRGKDKDVTQRSIFCSARDSAYASFRGIRWDFARFSYTADAGHDLNDLIDAVAACQDETKGPLSSNFNSSCGIISGPDEARQKAIIDETYETIKGRYFDEYSPITLMLVEKKTLADRVVQGSKGKVDRLKLRSDTLATTYGGARAYLDNEVAPGLKEMITNYKNAYATASAILARYKEWQEGLLEQGLEQSLTGDNSSKTRLIGKSRDMDTSNGFAGTMGVMAKRFAELVNTGENYEASGRKLCAIYYCYVTLGSESSSLYKQACNTQELFKVQKNPLCESTGQSLDVEGQKQTARAYCDSVGFDVEKYGRTGMNVADVKSCEVK